MTTPDLRARWRQRIEDLTYSDAEVAEWCLELMAEVDTLGQVRSLVESWPHGDNGQDYRAAVTQCRAAVLAAFDGHLQGGEGWASYAAEQERHAETIRARDEHYEARNLLAEKVNMLEAKLARSVSWSEVIRALRAADMPEDSMATDDDLLRYEGRAEAVEIMRDMLGV